LQIGQPNDPRRFNRETAEQRANRVTADNIDDDTLHVCSVCGTDEFTSKLTNVGDGKLECARCLREG